MGTDIERLGGDFPRHSNIVRHAGIVYLVGLTDDTGATTKEQTERILEKVRLNWRRVPAALNNTSPPEH